MFGFYFGVYIGPILVGLSSILLLGAAIMAYRWKKTPLTKLMMISFSGPIIGAIVQKMSFTESISENGSVMMSYSSYATYISTIGMFVGTMALFLFILRQYKNQT